MPLPSFGKLRLSWCFLRFTPALFQVGARPWEVCWVIWPALQSRPHRPNHRPHLPAKSQSLEKSISLVNLSHYCINDRREQRLSHQDREPDRGRYAFPKGHPRGPFLAQTLETFVPTSKMSYFNKGEFAYQFAGLP